ncbi:shikimate dehydrogenase [Gleimia hominis]|uniref:shikimate dehydrogenase n=1 Tax=Gleimia hominis TaxID=595468 RepID=UPI000C7F8960|nr:shikimate dehydrogenase [Gleimia hominis]WIK65097.1 shikimate dehydrogenase [Gleimia hominis]
MRGYVIGHPVAHSLSPVLHRAAYASLGLDHEFEAVDVTAELLPQWVQSRPKSFLGCAVTMPLKQAIIGVLDAVEPLAEAVGAVNTVVPSAGVLAGFNTDVHGIVQAVQHEQGHYETAVIVGGRATASSALAALGQLGAREIWTIARSFGGLGSITLAENRMGVSTGHVPWRNRRQALEVMARADVVISTVPRSVANEWADAPFQPGATVLDVVYEDWPTALATQAHARGARAVSGHEMLLHQAVQQVELMTGKSPDISAMRQAMDAAIDHVGRNS